MQNRLCSPINFAMHKIKPGTTTAETIKSSFEETIKSFVARDNAFSLISSVKGTSIYWKQFDMTYQLRLNNQGYPHVLRHCHVPTYDGKNFNISLTS